MTLHDAIEKVLEKNDRPMTSAEISIIINSKKLYARGDNEEIPASQISARVNKYPRLFIVDRSIKPYKIRLANRRYNSK